MVVLRQPTIGITTNDVIRMKTPYYRDDKKIHPRRATAVPVPARIEYYKVSIRYMLPSPNTCTLAETELTGEGLLEFVSMKICIKSI